jgi:hypothetical protein
MHKNISLYLLLLLSPSLAFAYIDPGAGSAIIAAILGFFVACEVFFKGFWYKIKAIFTGKKVAKPVAEKTVDAAEQKQAATEKVAKPVAEKTADDAVQKKTATNDK